MWRTLRGSGILECGVRRELGNTFIFNGVKAVNTLISRLV